MSDKRVTAAMLAIGDELLSGRTRDKNIGHLASTLTAVGIDLVEVRIVADDENAIVAAVNALRRTYQYVFTSGGIGPTHDDITADSIAAAFGLACTHHPEAMDRLREHYARREMEFSEARQRMARTPLGARLIDNPISIAPGFIVENVHVMAGVPSIFDAMLNNILPSLEVGRLLLSETVECPFGEGDIGVPLGAVQSALPDVSIGSYPRFDGERFSTQIVVRGTNADELEKAKLAVRQMLSEIASSKQA